MKKKIIISIFVTLMITLFSVLGTTYAYLMISATSSNIEGNVANFDVSLSLNTIYRANRLVPLSNDLIDEAITKDSDKCIDRNGYEVCFLFSLSLTNGGDAVTLNGYIETVSSTYTTDNLKYQIFDSNYTAVTDVMTLSNTSGTRVYFNKNANRLDLNLGASDTIYYLAVWLTETGDSQSSDYSKSFSGKVGFESIDGDTLEASFDT